MTTAADLFRDFLPEFRSGGSARQGDRAYEIDGLRGWAALSVVVYHMFWELFGVVMPSIRNPITGFFLNGGLAVSMFFVLSGDALSAAYFNGKGQLSVVKLMVKRYSRLAIPIISICIVVFLLCRFGLSQNITAGKLVSREDWLGSWLNFPANFSYFFKYSVLNVYIIDKPTVAVDPFLWTMKVELIGSIITFAVLIFFPYFRRPWTIIVAMAILALLLPHAGQFACFLFGIVFCAARSHGSFLRLRANRRVRALSWVGLVLAALAIGFLHWKGRNEMNPAFAIAITFFTFSNNTLSRFFQTKLSIFLGKISFPMYLTQFPVLISLTSAMIIFAANRGQLTPSVEIFIAVISVIVTLLTAIIFDPIEVVTKWFGNTMVKFLIHQTPPEANPT